MTRECVPPVLSEQDTPGFKLNEGTAHLTGTILLASLNAGDCDKCGPRCAPNIPAEVSDECFPPAGAGPSWPPAAA